MNDSERLEMGMEEQEDTLENKYLTFSIGSEEYGIEIRYVTEIIGIQSITELPDMPGYVKGVINLRGKVIPVIDVRIRFGLKEREYDERTSIIVVNLSEMSVGLIVDTVSEVMDIAASNVEPPPRVSKGAGSRYIQGMGKVGEEVKILLNIQKLLLDDEIQQLKSGTEA